MTVIEVRECLNKKYPENLALDFDNAGFLIGDPKAEVTKILVCLDITPEVLKEALELGANTVVSHHPVIFEPAKTIYKGDMIYEVIANKINAICYHTNLDIAQGGVNDCLAKVLGLSHITPFLLPGDDYTLARVGGIDPLPVEQFLSKVKDILGCGGIRATSLKKTVKKVAVCGGSGSGYIPNLVGRDIDLFITSQIKHEAFLFAKKQGLAVADLGHYETEKVVLPELVRVLKEAFHETEITISQKEENPVWYL